LRLYHNLQIQLLVKQGQVELGNESLVYNFKDCLLIDRTVVEQLNKIIENHGKNKISIMVNSKDYRKSIRQITWEHKKMKMTIEDYIQKQRDITYLKLTREVQEYLNLFEDYDNKKLKEVSRLEEVLTAQSQQYQRVYQQKAQKLKDINDKSVRIANKNDKFDERLTENNVMLHDRKHINKDICKFRFSVFIFSKVLIFFFILKIAVGKDITVKREQKFQQIVQRRKLVDLAKAQAQEVAFLRSEVERLRMKTFPALVQIEY
jgi:cilia- and flagella-associated protein 43